MYLYVYVYSSIVYIITMCVYKKAKHLKYDKE